MTWKTALSFVALATLLTVVAGWLVSAGILPIKQNINYTDAGLQFIRVWIWLAIAIGLILPGVAFFVWINHPEPRKIFGFYLLVLIVQIMTEQVVSSIWLPSLVVLIGTIYTAFRLWQLWQGQQLLKTNQNQLSYKPISGLLWFLFLFWLSNLIILLTLGWSSI